MKCIVFGLGNFGLALSQRLTKRGNEVLGVDSDISKINLYKDSITNTVALDVKKASVKELQAYLAEVLPNFDRDRVYVSDIKKLITWYNLLVASGMTDFEEVAEEAAEKEAAAE